MDEAKPQTQSISATDGSTVRDVTQIQADKVHLHIGVGLSPDIISRLLSTASGPVSGEQALQAQTQRLLSLDMQQIAEFQAASGITATITSNLPEVVLDPPPPVAYLVSRPDTVALLINDLRQHTWLGLHGGAATGKTQLARLLYQALGDRVIFVPINSDNSNEAALKLDSAFSMLAGSRPPVVRDRWYRSLVERLEPGTTVILDSVPDLRADDPFARRIVPLAQACQQHGVSIITTSAHQFPATIRDLFDKGILLEKEIPLFTDDEAAELFRLHGAPKEVRSPEQVRKLNFVTQGHPLLLSVLARYLEKARWNLTDDLIRGLFGNEYAQEAQTETIRRLLNTVQDEDSRSLLYRMGLADGPLTRQEVRAIAEVGDPIEAAMEHLERLRGLWVEEDEQHRFRVSPLIRTVSEDSVANGTKRQCYAALGAGIIRRGKIDQLDAAKGVYYFSLAGDLNRAGGLLALALRELASVDPRVPDAGLLAYWRDVALPAGMNHFVRLFLRAQQVLSGAHRGLPVIHLLEDLDNLVETAQPRDLVSLLGVLTSIPITRAVPVDNTRFHRYVLKAAQLATASPEKARLEKVFHLPVQPETWLWWHVTQVRTPSELLDWITTLEHLTPEQRSHVFEDHLAEEASLFLVDNLWLAESKKLPASQDWNALLKTLEDFGIRMREVGGELQWACSVRARTVVYAEYLNDLSSAVDLAESALRAAGADARIRFILSETIGRQRTVSKDVALEWLQRALGEPTNAYPYLHVLCLISASCAIGDTDAVAAIAYLQQAVQLAQSTLNVDSSGVMPTVAIAQVLGEMIIAQWLAGDLGATFDALERAIEYLLSIRAPSDDWRGLFQLIGHISGYLTSLVRLGNAPPSTAAGDEYAAPSRGMFLGDLSLVAPYYREDRECFSFAQLSMFAEALGKDERAMFWALRGLELALARNQTVAIAVLGLDAVPHFLRQHMYGDALQNALHATRAAVALKTLHDKGEAPLDRTSFDIEVVLGPRDSALSLSAEDLARQAALLPIFFQIGIMQLQDPSEASAKARLVAETCQEMAGDASPSIWETASEVLNEIFVEGTGFDALVNRANAINDSSHTLRAIGYVGASLQRDALPSQAIAAHLATIPYVTNAVRASAVTYRSFVVPFLVDYWRRRVGNAGFRFRNPRLVSNEIDRISKLPADRCAPELLQLIADALDVKPRTQERDWIASAQQS